MKEKREIDDQDWETGSKRNCNGMSRGSAGKSRATSWGFVGLWGWLLRLDVLLLILKEKERGPICMLRFLGGELLNWVTFDSIMAFLNMVKVNAFYW